MEDEKQSEKKLEMLKNQCTFLKNSFDTIHIFATKCTNDDTVSFNVGVGNWKARIGQIKDWVIEQDERTREDARKKL